MASYTAQAIIDDIKASTDHDGAADTQVTTAQLLVWIDAAYKKLRRALVDLVPDLYTVVSASVVVTSPATSFSLTAGGAGNLTLTDFEKIRKVERQFGTDWVPMLVAPALTSSIQAFRGYRLRGTSVDLFPTTQAPGTYRVIYLSTGVTIDGTSDTLELPGGADRIIVEEVAARVRIRLDEDPAFHLQMREQTWAETRDYLRRQYLATPRSVVDLTGRY